MSSVRSCVVASLLLCVSLSAQTYNISTLAGGVPPPTPAGALQTAIGIAQGMVYDAAGNLYFSSNLHCVFRVDPTSLITLVAGNARVGYSGDGGPATAAQLNNPGALAVDSAGNIYIADTGNNAVRVVSTNGTITTRLTVNGIRGISVSPSGELAVSDATGVRGLGGRFGPVLTTVAQMNSPYGLAFDSSGTLYVAESGANRVRKIDRSGVITTVAGTGVAGDGGDGGPATQAQLAYPFMLAVDALHNLYFLDGGGNPPGIPGPFGYQVRKISSNGIISTSIKSGKAGVIFFLSLAADPVGRVSVATDTARIGTVTFPGSLTYTAGSGAPGYPGDGGPASMAELSSPVSAVVDSEGDVYIADFGNRRIRKVLPDGTIVTVVDFAIGNIPGQGSASSPTSLGISPEGDLYFFDSHSFNFWQLRSTGMVEAHPVPLGVVSIFTDSRGMLYFVSYINPFETLLRYVGDQSRPIVIFSGFFAPGQIAADTAGNLYYGNFSHINEISLTGKLSTYANASTVAAPGLAFDAAGNLYVSESCRVDRIAPDLTVQTIAGTGACGYSGDGGPALSAQLNPGPLAIDSSGNIYIVETANNAVRLLTPQP